MWEIFSPSAPRKKETFIKICTMHREEAHYINMYWYLHSSFHPHTHNIQADTRRRMILACSHTCADKGSLRNCTRPDLRTGIDEGKHITHNSHIQIQATRILNLSLKSLNCGPSCFLSPIFLLSNHLFPCLPLQVVPSEASSNPSSQVHMNEPYVFKQPWEQGFVSHSSTSGEREKGRMKEDDGICQDFQWITTLL